MTSGAEELASEEPAKLLTRWRDGYIELAGAIAHLPGGAHLPWFGPGMSAASMVTARAFGVNGLAPPDEPIRVELTAPDGSTWAWGPEDAAEMVTGPALDFCLLATQRRHRDDLAVRTSGEHADQWLEIAQAFAGPSGPGRVPGQFPRR